jgi:serine/threonine protein kinase
MSEPRVLGPYTLISELGAGGMGTVHLAEAGPEAMSVAAGRKVAVKIVHPQLVSTPGFFKRFMREAEVGKLIDHENVVRTIDVDAAEFEGRTVLYLVMEYVEGGTLRSLQHELGSLPEALLREIALQVSAGLTAIHAEGIIHRDLKPENVLITNDQQVRIMDLGVAKLQEASVVITREGQFAGSFLYAAPEQFRSEEVGPAIDLYSTGVMLYELATGTNPFRGDDAASVIHAHLHTNPPRASEVNPDTSEFSAEVLATLLSKKPQERFDSAATLHGLLEEGEESVWWHERATRLKKRERLLPPIQVRRDTALHGREKELEAIQAAWKRTQEGEGNTLLLEGEAGIGKTRLIDEFLRSLHGIDANVLYGAYPPSGGLGGLSDSILSKFDNTNLAEAVAPYLTVTPSLIPAFAALVRHESPPSGSEPLRGDALHATSTSHRSRASRSCSPWRGPSRATASCCC